jgi:hypothetical protein
MVHTKYKHHAYLLSFYDRFIFSKPKGRKRLVKEEQTFKGGFVSQQQSKVTQ